MARTTKRTPAKARVKAAVRRVVKKVRTRKAAPTQRPSAKKAPALHLGPFTATDLLPPALRAPAPRPRLLALDRVERLLSHAMKRGGDFAEVYVERTVVTSLSLDEGAIKAANVSETT